MSHPINTLAFERLCIRPGCVPLSATYSLSTPPSRALPEWRRGALGAHRIYGKAHLKNPAISSGNILRSQERDIRITGLCLFPRRNSEVDPKED